MNVAEILIVGLAIAGAASYIAYRAYRNYTARKSACGKPEGLCNCALSRPATESPDKEPSSDA